MKQCTISFLLLLLTNMGFAQKKLSSFGTADKEELQMKEYPKDPSAAALVLGDEGSVQFQYDDSRSSNLFQGGNMRTTRTDRSTFLMERKIRTRIKIFSDKGLIYANVKLYYNDDNKYEQINDIEGYVYNLNDAGETVTTKLEKDQVFRKKENDISSSVSFSLPGVKPGSVIEYRYTIIKKSFSMVNPWHFQREIPTQVSSFNIEIPEQLKFAIELNANEDSKPVKLQEELTKNLSGSRNNDKIRVYKHSYTLSNIAGLQAEPYMSGYKNYLQRVSFQLSQIEYSPSDIRDFTTTWESLATDLDEFENFGYQLRKNVSLPELEAALAKTISPKEKIEQIHHYMRTRFDWDGVYDFYCLNIKKIAEKRSGSTGDINLLMLSLMLHNGIEAWPVLVSTRKNGAILKAYPFLQQFNTVVVLAKAGEKYYILNGADKYTPTHLIPPDVMTAEGLILNKAASDWIDLWDASMIAKRSVAYMATITEDGGVSGDAYITSSGYDKNEPLMAMKAGNEKYFSDYLNSKSTGMTIEGFTVQNADNDTLDLVQKFKFKYKINSSGGYLYFKMNLFTGLDNNPFLSAKRWSDVDFGYNRRIMLNTRVTIPENFQVEALPKSTPLALPESGIVFTPSYYQEDNVITLRMSFEINKPLFTLAEYPNLREIYKKMYDLLNEQIVMKKK